MLNKNWITAVVAGAFISLSIPALADNNTGSSVTTDQTIVATQPVQDGKQLAYKAQDKRLSVEERAAALTELADHPNQNSLVAVARGLRDENAVIRRAAVEGARPYKIEHRWRMVSPLLQDADQSVRITATTNLIRDYRRLTRQQQNELEHPVSELENHLEQQQDFDSQLLLADVYRWHSEWDKAEVIYSELLKNHQDNENLWLSYAENFSAQHQDKKAIGALDKAMKLNSDSASLHYSKSLALVRLGRKTEAAHEIEIAAELAERNSYYWYLNGVLQEPLDIKKSTQAFETAYLLSGAPEQLYAVCDIYIRHNHQNSDKCLEELSQIAPAFVIEELKAKQH